MSLFSKIKAIYPTLEVSSFLPPDIQIIIRDDLDGNGPYIDKWDHPVFPRPSDEELDAAPEYDEPPAPPVLTPAEKLANAGLTVDELKTLLGLS